MKAEEFARKLTEYKKESDPIIKMGLMNELCDVAGYAHFLEFVNGEVDTTTGEYESTEIAKMISKAEYCIEDGYALYDLLPKEYAVGLNDDDKKIKLIGKTKDEEEKIKIIASLKSDENKKELLDSFIKETKLGVLMTTYALKTIKDDSIIESFISKADSQYTKTEIIRTLHSDELKEQHLKDVKGDRELEINIVDSMKSDEKKIAWMMENETYTRDLIGSLDSDDEKVKMLSFLGYEDIPYVLARLKSDELKLRIMRNGTYSIPNRKVLMLVQSLSNDDLKLRNIDIIEDNNLKKELFRSLRKVSTEAVVDTFYSEGRKIIHRINDSNRQDYSMGVTQKYTSIGIDPKLTIGTEIETVGPWFWLLREYPIINKNWHVKMEYSLADGLEITSPVMRDTPDNVTDIYKVNTYLRELGFGADEGCGGHIHFGSDYFTTKESYERLVELWVNTESILYKICNKVDTKEREDALYQHAKPYGREFDQNEFFDIDECDTDGIRKKLVEVQNDERSFTINFSNLGNSKNTIEFRISNGTVDPNTWIDNIRLFGRMMMVSEELGKLEHKKDKTYGEEMEIYNVSKLKDKSKTEEEKFNILMELLFCESKYRKIYERRFKRNPSIMGHSEIHVADFKNLSNYIFKPSKEKFDADEQHQRYLKYMERKNEQEIGE